MWTGRIRHIDHPEQTHKAMSFLIQGGVAEMMRVVVTRLGEEIRGVAHMILQVHDEILFEVRADKITQCAQIVRRIMEDFSFRVPIQADIKVGASWGSLSPLPRREISHVANNTNTNQQPSLALEDTPPHNDRR
jgi:hypothetical protein